MSSKKMIALPEELLVSNHPLPDTLTRIPFPATSCKLWLKPASSIWTVLRSVSELHLGFYDSPRCKTLAEPTRGHLDEFYGIFDECILRNSDGAHGKDVR
jgi:hypothetical protein